MWVTNGEKDKAFEKLMAWANTLADYLPDGTVELQFDPAKYRVKDSDGYVTVHFVGIQSFGDSIKDILLEMIRVSDNFIIKPVAAEEVELIFGIFNIHKWDDNRRLELTDEEKMEFGLTDEEMGMSIEEFAKRTNTD